LIRLPSVLVVWTSTNKYHGMGCCRPHRIRDDGSSFFFVAFRNWFFVMDVAQLIPDTDNHFNFNSLLSSVGLEQLPSKQ
jgi:hypothetical protein